MAKEGFSVQQTLSRVPLAGSLLEVDNATRELINATPAQRTGACRNSIHDSHIDKVAFIGPALLDACSLFE